MIVSHISYTLPWVLFDLLVLVLAPSSAGKLRRLGGRGSWRWFRREPAPLAALGLHFFSLRRAGEQNPKPLMCDTVGRQEIFCLKYVPVVGNGCVVGVRSSYDTASIPTPYHIDRVCD